MEETSTVAHMDMKSHSEAEARHLTESLTLAELAVQLRCSRRHAEKLVAHGLIESYDSSRCRRLGRGPEGGAGPAERLRARDMEER